MTLVSGNIRFMRIFAGVPWEGRQTIVGLSCRQRHDNGNFQRFRWLWTEPVSYSKCSKWRTLWPSRMHAATHILQKTHACGVLKRHKFRVHVSLGSAETLVRIGGIINHHSIAYSLSNISAKNYRNRLMWVESIVCNIGVVFWDTVYVTFNDFEWLEGPFYVICSLLRTATD